MLKFILKQIYKFSNSHNDDVKVDILSSMAIVLLKVNAVQGDVFDYKQPKQLEKDEYLQLLVLSLSDIVLKNYQDELFETILTLIYNLGYEPMQCLEFKISNFEKVALKFDECKMK